MARFAVGPFRSRYKNLRSGPPLGSFRHAPGFVRDSGWIQRRRGLFSPPLIYKGRLGGVSRKRSFFCALVVRFAYARTAPYEKYPADFSFALQRAFWVWLVALVGPYEKHLSDFGFALQCSFWVWLASLSSFLAVNSDTCSSALSQARYAMTRVLFYCNDKSASARFLGMAPFAVWPSRRRYRYLLVGHPLCSFRHDPGLFYGKGKSAPCSFWAWLPTLRAVSQAVGLVTPAARSSAPSQALSAMTRIFRGKAWPRPPFMNPSIISI